MDNTTQSAYDIATARLVRIWYIYNMYMTYILRRVSPRPILFGRRRDLGVKPKRSRARVKQHINLSRKYGTMAPG